MGSKSPFVRPDWWISIHFVFHSPLVVNVITWMFNAVKNTIVCLVLRFGVRILLKGTVRLIEYMYSLHVTVLVSLVLAFLFNNLHFVPIPYHVLC